MAYTAFSGFCYGGPAHGEIFKVRANQPYLTVMDPQAKVFCYRLHNIPPGSEAWHWLPATVADDEAMDFVIDKIMTSISDEPQELVREGADRAVRRVQGLFHR